jgi:hypothetical protein
VASKLKSRLCHPELATHALQASFLGHVIACLPPGLGTTALVYVADSSELTSDSLLTQWWRYLNFSSKATCPLDCSSAQLFPPWPEHLPRATPSVLRSCVHSRRLLRCQQGPRSTGQGRTRSLVTVTRTFARAYIIRIHLMKWNQLTFQLMIKKSFCHVGRLF